MAREILRVKVIENGKTITEFSMEFRKWRKLHREGGGKPHTMQTGNKSCVEITLRSEEVDAGIEKGAAGE